MLIILNGLQDSEREKMHLQKILVKIQTDTKGHADTATEPVDVTDKVKALVRLLDATWSPNVRGLIFVEQRAVVAALASLLREKALTSSTWSIGAFVGTSSFANRKANLADLAEFKEQTQDLEDFYRGKKNLMITTSVLEEGIDVSKSMGRRVTRTTR
jgi:superfamily II DNA/RNA helicase